MPLSPELEDFRREGHRLIDWIARYLANPEPFPVVPRVRPGELRVALPGPRRRRSPSPWPTRSPISSGRSSPR